MYMTNLFSLFDLDTKINTLIKTFLALTNKQIALMQCRQKSKSVPSFLCIYLCSRFSEQTAVGSDLSLRLWATFNFPYVLTMFTVLGIQRRQDTYTVYRAREDFGPNSYFLPQVPVLDDSSASSQLIYKIYVIQCKEKKHAIHIIALESML